MGDRARVLAWLITAMVLCSCLAFTGAQGDGNSSASVSVSTSGRAPESVPIWDRNPCVFRGSLMSHGQEERLDSCTLCTCENRTVTCTITSCPSDAGEYIPIEEENPCFIIGSLLEHGKEKRLDPCTLCTCQNGTTTCIIEACPNDAGCFPSEIVLVPEECCPLCPYEMFVENTNNLFDSPFYFAEGDSRKIRFDLDIEVERKLSSRIVRGNNLWKLGAWVSRNEDGSGMRFAYSEQIFKEKDAAQEYFKPNSPPWRWNKLKYTMHLSGGTCDDYNFFCVKFGQADEPSPLYDLSFTFQAVDNEQERLIDCMPLGECRGLEAVGLDWELDATNAVYGQSTPISLNVDVLFTPESPDKEGEGMWRVGIFGSGIATGAGARFGEISQTLDEEGMATRKEGRTPNIDDIAADFEIGTIGCTDDHRYVCVEFAQGDAPASPFTLLIDTPSNTLVTCKEQGCYARCLVSDGWMEWQGGCYKMIGDADGSKNSWEVIRDACFAAGPLKPGVLGTRPIAHLADVDMEEENQFIARNVLDGQKAWLGAVRNSDGGFNWNIGVRGDSPPVSYGNWKKNEPNNRGGAEDCVEINKGREEGQWNDLQCHWKRFGVCEYDY